MNPTTGTIPAFGKADAKPESLYPGASTAKSMRPTGSSDLRKTSTGHSNSGFAVGGRTMALKFQVATPQFLKGTASLYLPSLLDSGALFLM